jgi:PAS domain S-box-containing protein
LNLFRTFKKHLQRKSIADQLLYGIMAATVISLLFIGHYWTSLETRRFKKQSDEIRDRFVNSRMDLARDEVTRAIGFINYNRSLSEERMRLGLKQRVDEAWAIASNIYEENKATKSRSEIEKMIRDALRPIRFSNDRGDIFIYTTSGVSVLLPRSKHLENIPSLDHQDQHGNYVVRKEVELLRQVDQGFIHYYVPGKDNPGDSTLLKSSYIRRFAPFNWYLGSKDYLEDFEAVMKERILEYLSKIRYGNDGYLFVNTIGGEALITNGVKHLWPQDIRNSKDSNWIQVYQKQVDIYNTSGSGFIEYQFRRLMSEDFETKISYLGTVKEWGWIVGTGFYENEVESFIRENRKLMEAQIRSTIAHIVLSLLVVLIFIWLVSRWISRKFAQGFAIFNLHFRKAGLESIEINQKNLVFSEFRELAESVNAMTEELNNARKSLVKERSLLRSLIDSSPDFIFFKDLNSNFVGCNKAFADYVGIEESELIGRNDYDFFQKEAADKYHQFDRQIIADHIPVRSEEWITMADGSRRLMDTLKVLNFDSAGNPIGIVAISRDISDKEEIQQKYIEAKEKAEEADRLKTAFLANMSHEIRTPMNSIIGFSNLLTEEDLTPEDKAEFIRHINHGSETLLSLIDDIIDIAKIEAGQLMVTFEPYNLREMMDELYVTHAELLKRKGKDHVKLVLEKDQLPGSDVVLTDPFRLKQVMTNLLVNAVKFTEKGSITYGYKVTGDFLNFYVKDTGIGISPEGLKVIFERFRQDNRYGIKHQGGTGLGLAISRHIVQLLGGDITVTSSPGEGALFSFIIPYNAYHETVKDKRKGRDSTFNMDWSAKTILVVEDVESHYNYIRSALMRTGINMLRVTSGQESVDICLNDHQIDIVLMDVNLPDMDGYTATGKIKAHKPEIPVIAQTAYNQPGEEERSRKAGCDAYISKPVKLKELLDALAGFLGNQT